MPDDAGASSAPSSVPAPAVNLTNSLEDFQSDEQRLVLDTVAQIRKCGLEAVLPLPQIVVCGNQSSGKSSVLEALTEVPFPRNDNLCTRFATEITLRRGAVDSLRLSIIPDENRSAAEKATINAFSATVADFAELPGVMSKAATVMGINPSTNDSSAAASTRAFAKDVLSFEIEGPTRPQLTVVDVPGLIQNATKGVTEQDKEMVAEITDFYIKQRRTICLAVIQATDDYANQPILTKVREVDPKATVPWASLRNPTGTTRTRVLKPPSSLLPEMKMCFSN
jgi:GTPase SAR1 family protein